MSHERLCQDLAEWRELGWLRMLDEQFARFLGQLAPNAGEDVLLAAVLASHQLGRGHVCLPLARCLDNPKDPTLRLLPCWDNAIKNLIR